MKKALSTPCKPPIRSHPTNSPSAGRCGYPPRVTHPALTRRSRSLVVKGSGNTNPDGLGSQVRDVDYNLEKTLLRDKQVSDNGGNPIHYEFYDDYDITTHTKMTH